MQMVSLVGVRMTCMEGQDGDESIEPEEVTALAAAFV